MDILCLIFLIWTALILTDLLRARVKIEPYNKNYNSNQEEEEETMMLILMESFIKEARKEYRNSLEGRVRILPNQVEENYLSCCYCDFEKQTLKENLMEEFFDYYLNKAV